MIGRPGSHLHSGHLFASHLGGAVSALVDGQLDPQTTERAWDHVVRCRSCRAAVERETWLKRRLSTLEAGEPSQRLLGSLQQVPGRPVGLPSWPHAEAAVPWAGVDPVEDSSPRRRRAGLALAGVGSISAAVAGMAAMGALGLVGGPPTANLQGGTPSQNPSRPALTNPISVLTPGATPSGRAPSPLRASAFALHAR